MKVAFSSSFNRAFRKRIKNNVEIEDRFWTRMEWFTADPKDPRLRPHKLSGKLEDLWSFSVTYDVRVIFYFAGEDKAVFIDIGTHDEVY